MTAFFIIMALMSVPLAGIISRTVLKSKALNSRALEAEVRALTVQNTDLERRMQVLETIATSDGHLFPEDIKHLQLPAPMP